MAKRYHASKREKVADYRERSERVSDINHHSDKFNDEKKHDKDSRAGFDWRAIKSAELYAGMEPRRRQELEDAGMIHEDYRAMANLPQEVIMRHYPPTGPYLPEGLDDSIRGVDGQMDYDDEKRREHFYPKKV